MFHITLSGLQFHLPIGLYPEEQVLGNEIEIDLTIQQPARMPGEFTVDYEKVYRLIERETQQKETLLENLMDRIAQKLKEQYPQAAFYIKIKKYNPPFGGRASFVEIGYKTPDFQ